MKGCWMQGGHMIPGGENDEQSLRCGRIHSTHEFDPL